MFRIAQSLALTAVGNAAFAGRDIGRFWPDAHAFVFSKTCEFLIPVEGETDTLDLVARDPLEWFDAMRPRCSGFRLHAAPMRRGPNQTLPVEERMLAGMVGGGPRVLIEAVGANEVWEGFDRVGDKNDPDRKIWMHGYIRQSDAPPADATLSVADATRNVAAALSDIETFARDNGSHFADVFTAARAALDQGASDQLDLVGYAGLGEDAARLLESAGRGWVFGGMGSWNDGAVGDPARYEEISERLYLSLIAGFVAVANATYRPSDS